MNDPKYGYPYPPQGVYQGPPPVMAPPQYYAPPPPPQRQVGFLEGWYAFYIYPLSMNICCIHVDSVVCHVDDLKIFLLMVYALQSCSFLLLLPLG
ncbi:hypothetical protein OIU77_028656 [Salix suchowensis]|uniref:Rhodopsin n=1 Tax=Salix suchowensis TaxID=1278906 RepID=A0ABQ9BK84_9ROSI|nr:hypothetical protein OIU77_028656 [Salix suchowensis]